MELHPIVLCYYSLCAYNKQSDFLSIFIQFADTYVHLTTKAIDLTQVLPESSTVHTYSRTLSSACLNQPKIGAKNNSNFWSCGVEYQESVADNGTILGSIVSMPRIYPVRETQSHVSRENRIWEYIHENGSHMAILGPVNPDLRLDWSASTFGVSTSCRAIRNDSCEIYFDEEDGSMKSSMGAFNFNCSQERASINVSGTVYGVSPQYSWLDFHKYITDLPPFSNHNITGGHINYRETAKRAAALDESEQNDIFLNPWRWMSVIHSGPGTKFVGIAKNDSEKNFVTVPTYSSKFMMLDCSTTGKILQHCYSEPLLM